MESKYIQAYVNGMLPLKDMFKGWSLVGNYEEEGRMLYRFIRNQTEVFHLSGFPHLYPEEKTKKIFPNDDMISRIFDLPQKVFSGMLHINSLSESLVKNQPVPKYSHRILNGLLGEDRIVTSETMREYLIKKQEGLWAGRISQFSYGLEAIEDGNDEIARKSSFSERSSWGKNLQNPRDLIMNNAKTLREENGDPQLGEDIEYFMQWIGKNFKIDYDNGLIALDFRETEPFSSLTDLEKQ